ncbi:MAG: TetR/AcrR family transcriptional regulator [Leptolyngbyaceae cyanobacterium MO_188.B28]|nr:TetR/AcrR family transcriptional regulator [Leptolyngbyaceae cyanobacterium MO_188.B28]
MSKAQFTREKILQKSAALFNRQGYAGSSMSDIMQVTGLKKGGIYNHFKSKDELALEAFDYIVGKINQRYSDALKGKRHALDRLRAIIQVFRVYIDEDDFLLKGGCPVLNTAVESDDTHPALRQRVQAVMNSWRHLIHRFIDKGIERRQIRPDVDADTVATIMISSLEGAVMMSKLYGDPVHMQRAIAHLDQYVQTLAVQG